MEKNEEENAIERVGKLLSEITQISEESLSQAIYTKYFNEVFHNQINSLYQREKDEEIIVLLQKKFDFHIIVTTHSSHFYRSVGIVS